MYITGVSIMNNKSNRPPYIILLLGGLIGIPLGDAVVSIFKCPTINIKDYLTFYLRRLESVVIYREIYYIILISIIYLVIWLNDIKHKKIQNT